MTGLPRLVRVEGCEGILPTTIVGLPGATRVRIVTGRFAGCVGVVVRIHHVGSIDVRLTRGPADFGRVLGLEFPFGRSEMEVIP